MKLIPHNYQFDAACFMFGRRAAGLFLDPGLGKTSISLAVINALLKNFIGEKVLIIAPVRVAHTVWPAECSKWDQFKHLRTSIIGNDESERIAALKADVDIYLINPESVAWLQKQYELLKDGKSLSFTSLPKFDVLIIDESTKFKSPRMKTKKNLPTRFAAVRKMLPDIERRYILTGTPTPKSLIDLWSQIYILDGGERLGKKISHFRDRWFNRGFHVGQYHPKPNAKKEIEAAIADIVLVMDCRDYLDMPELIFNDIWVQLPPKVRKAYNKLERDLFFEMDGGLISELALNSTSKYGMCRQVANGGLYVERDSELKKYAVTHDEKLDAVADLHDELGSKPLMVLYLYQHELARLRKRFGKDVPTIAGGVSGKDTERIVADWNAGKSPMIFCQPDAMSHGLNMQDGGSDMVWLGPTNNLETWLQVIARLWRQGQTAGGVRVHRILAENTVDVAIKNCIEEKDENQTSFLTALKNYRDSRLSNEPEFDSLFDSVI